MPLDPMERNPVSCHQRSKSHPQIRVLDLGKTLSLPVLKPAFVDGIDDIGRIAVHMHLGILPLDGFQPLDYSQKFHPVVCGHGKTS